MDVRCPSCGTDYELNDARVPDTGLPVKCSKCGHVFRAMRPAAPQSNEPAKVVTGVHTIAPEWMIRRVTGEMVRFRELTTLQRWIVERKVTRNDEISKTGKKWEKLGNIPELAVFFQVVEGKPEPLTPDAAADAALQMTPPPPPVTTDAGRPAAPASLEPSFRTGPDPFSETLPDPTGAHPSLSSPFQRPNVPLHIEPTEHRQETVRWSMSPSIPDEVREEYEVSEKREISGERPGRDELMPRRFGVTKLLLSLILLAAACLAVTYVVHPSWLRGLYRKHITGIPPEAIRNVDDAYAALRSDTASAIEDAVGKLESAVALDDTYPAANAGLAEALVARAELSRDLADAKAAALNAQPVADPAPELAKVAELRTKADADLQRASELARHALELDDTGLAPNRAMLDVVRLRGDSTRVDQLALQAHAVSPDDARLSLVLGGLALREAAASERATKYLEAALTADPQLNHARYLLARLAAVRGEKNKAIDHLKRLLEASPEHERGLALQANLGAPVDKPVEAAKPEEQPAVGSNEPVLKTEVSAKADGSKPLGTATKDAPKTPEAPAKPEGPKAADDPTLTMAEAMARGERLRNADKPGLAVRYYERALVLSPNDPDALLGVGWCRLDLHETNAAIAAFKKSLEIAPRLSDANFGLAEAYRTRGNKIAAIRYYKLYLDIAPHGPEADVARTQLARLEDDNSGAAPAEPAPQPQPDPPPPPEPPNP